MTTSEHLTFMFSDIVGSTALFSSLSPRDADRVRGRHFQVLEGALATTGGRLVKNLGDGAMAVFGACSEAMNCAVVLQQAAWSDRRDSDVVLELRIGLSTGDVTEEDDDYFGDAVVEAARLCALAQPGQVLVTSKVRIIAGRYAAHACRPLGTMTLKGLPDPADVEEVVWEPAPAFEFPAPPRLRKQAGFFGRGAELTALEEALKSAGAGEPRIVLLAGEAGIGKTTLATEFALSARERGAVVLHGRCDERLRAPFQPFEEALDHYVAHAPDRLLASFVQAHGSDLVRLVPGLARRVPDLPAPTAGDPDTERHALFRSVSSLLAAASTHQPTILLLDDLHWANEDTLQLLLHIATSHETARVLVVGSYRGGEVGAMHPLAGVLGSLRREGEPIRLPIGGWTEDDIAALLERDGVEGGPSDDLHRIAEALARESGGNPFFVTELLHQLASNGTLARDGDGHWQITGELSDRSLPASVREVLTERLQPLGEEGREVLQTAAVIGRDFDFDVLRAASGLGEEELLDILDLAVSGSLLRETSDAGGSPSFSFHQAVIRTALLESIGPNRRRLLHRRIAESLEASDGPAGTVRTGSAADLAYHFAAAGREHSSEAIRYATMAAEEALARLAPQEAAAHLAAAVAMREQLGDDDASAMADLLVALGSAQRVAGSGEYRTTLLRAARLAAEAGDGERLVRAALANTRGFTSTTGAVDSELVGVLEQAVEVSPPRSAERALVLASLCSELQYDVDVERRRRLGHEAEELCVLLGDEALAVTVANRMFSALQTSYPLTELLQRTEATLRTAERVGDGVQLFWARLWRTYALRSAGSLHEADMMLEAASALAGELGQPLLEWWATNVAAVGAWMRGDAAETIRLATVARTIGMLSGQHDADILWYSLEFGAAWIRGDLEAARPLIASAAAELPGDPAIFVSQVLAAAESDDLDGCRLALEGVAERIASLGVASTLPVALSILAEAAVRLRSREGCIAIEPHLARFADQVAHTGASTAGPVSHYLGGLAAVLGRFEEAEAHYERAAVIADGMGGRFFSARTALDRAVMLTERGSDADLDRAASLLATAAALAEAGSYAVVARRAALATAALRRTAPGHPDDGG